MQTLEQRLQDVAKRLVHRPQQQSGQQQQQAQTAGGMPGMQPSGAPLMNGVLPMGQVPQQPAQAPVAPPSAAGAAPPSLPPLQPGNVPVSAPSAMQPSGAFPLQAGMQLPGMMPMQPGPGIPPLGADGPGGMPVMNGSAGVGGPSNGLPNGMVPVDGVNPSVNPSMGASSYPPPPMPQPQPPSGMIPVPGFGGSALMSNGAPVLIKREQWGASSPSPSMIGVSSVQRLTTVNTDG